MTLHMPPDKLDELLSDHLAGTLDQERGRAAAAFRAHLSNTKKTATPAAAPRTNQVSYWNRQVPRKALWLWAGLPSALAAGLAVALTLFVVQSKNPAIQPGPTNNSIAQNIDRVETSHDVNAGITLLSDNTPVRVIRRQSVTQTQWQDPVDHATYSVTEPGEKVGYVKVQPY